MDYLKNGLKRNQYFFPTKKERHTFSNMLAQQISVLKEGRESLLFLCIGTDKITGDCLGPLVGTKLMERQLSVPVFGTLKHPIHAMNLISSLSRIRQRYPHPFMVVIDAAVGPAERIGSISLCGSSLHPGKGVRHPLPPVGNISITGIISEATNSSEQELPYTRLYLVNTLADFICECICNAAAVIQTEQLIR